MKEFLGHIIPVALVLNVCQPAATKAALTHSVVAAVQDPIVQKRADLLPILNESCVVHVIPKLGLIERLHRLMVRTKNFFRKYVDKIPDPSTAHEREMVELIHAIHYFPLIPLPPKYLNQAFYKNPKNRAQLNASPRFRAHMGWADQRYDAQPLVREILTAMQKSGPLHPELKRLLDSKEHPTETASTALSLKQEVLQVDQEPRPPGLLSRLDKEPRLIVGSFIGHQKLLRVSRETAEVSKEGLLREKFFQAKPGVPVQKQLRPYLESPSGQQVAGNLEHLDLNSIYSNDQDLKWISLHFPKVRSLKLRGHNLTNNGLKHVSELKNLESLSLSHYGGTEAATGAALEYLASLTGLKELTLYRFDLDHYVHHIENFKQLEKLEITHTPLSSLPNFSHLKNLKTLTLRDCFEQDISLAFLAKLPELSELDLGENPDLTWTGLAADHSLKKLRVLDISRTSVKLASISGQNQLQSLKLWHSATTVDLVLLKNFSELRDLDLSGCEQINGSGLTHLKELKNLKSLSLERIPMADDSLAHLSKIAGLQSLNVAHCHIDNDGLPRLAELSNLKELNLASNKIDGRSFSLLFPELKQLEVLNLNFTDTSDASLVHLSHLLKLKKLFLNQVPVTDWGLDRLSQLKKLEELALRGVVFNKDTLESLTHFSQLKSLDLAYSTGLTQKDLVKLESLKQLRRLNLTECGFYDKDLPDGLIFADLHSYF